MVDVLLDLKENHHVSGVKAEFEAEGTRIEEAMRLKEILMKADIGLTLKIGGCEAIRDIYEARVLGVSRIVAPMIESPYAFSKFIGAINSSIPDDEKNQISFAINIETQQAVKCLDEILSFKGLDKLGDIVVGRVDLSQSMGLSREDINSEPVTSVLVEVLKKSKNKGLKTAVGGGVSADSLSVFRNIEKGLLDRYETRKVIFDCPGALSSGSEAGILKAVYFELLWLKNKRDYYGRIFLEDKVRIEMLEQRYKAKIEGVLRN